MKTCMLVVLLLFVPTMAVAQRLDLPAQADDSLLEEAVAGMSGYSLVASETGGEAIPQSSLAHLQIAAGRYRDAAGTIRSVMAGLVADDDEWRAERWVPYLIHAQAMNLEISAGKSFDDAYGQAFRDYFSDVDDLSANRIQYWFSADVEQARADMETALEQQQGRESISLPDALELARRHAFLEVYRTSAQISSALIAEDEQARYLIQDDVTFRTPEGATLSAVVVRGKKHTEPLPTALHFTIYTNLGNHRTMALQAAARGYAGVVVDTRGKRLSQDNIVPYEHEADDAHAAVDWVSRQPWSNGEVGMYGGSYSGFAAWAAAKRGHPALKTIVPYVAAIPGYGLPMENNVFISANYAWAFYVANNRSLDADTYFQHERWQALTRDWYASGRPYREIDQVDGTPNPLLQRWLRHPAYDEYWQAMVPYREDFARIDIPVLTITGYYDDGQLSALHYFREHYRYKPDAEHYLLIGPYDHFGAQAPFKPRLLRGYEIDPVAQFDTQEITFQWLDHVLRGGDRPALLKDRANYQVMGADAWRHAVSPAAMGGDPTMFYFTGTKTGEHHLLSRDEPAGQSYLEQQVDFADRTRSSHGYYPDPIVMDELKVESGLSFISEPFDRPVSISGLFSGELKVLINKRDMDFTVVLYEAMPGGEVMQLSHHLGRASFAADMSERTLLTPGEWASISFERTRMVSRRMGKGSRLLVVLDVVKDALHQINYGTGKDVSDESIADAAIPLDVKWRSDSHIRVPILVEPAE